MSFADLQDRINAKAVSRLGQSVVVGGKTVQAVFNQVHVSSNLGDFGASATQSSLILASADIPDELTEWINAGMPASYPDDISVQIDDIGYTIVAHEPSAGMSTLVLERA